MVDISAADKFFHKRVLSASSVTGFFVSMSKSILGTKPKNILEAYHGEDFHLCPFLLSIASSLTAPVPDGLESGAF